MQLPSTDEVRVQLSAAYGFRIPFAFARLVHHAMEETTREGFFDYWTFFNYYHFFDFKMPVEVHYEEGWKYVPDKTYEDYYTYGLPPELCMFGKMDSLRFGYIVHDPSLDCEEWPVGKVAENELGVIRYGNNTKEGLESFVAFARMRYRHFKQEGESYAIEANKRFEKLRGLFDLNLERDDLLTEYRETYDYGEKKVRAVPQIPAGWHFIQSVDGVGVLAPREMFAGHRIDNLEDTADVERLMQNGHYATALLALRNTLWPNWHGSDEFYDECAVLMKECYLKMGRPLYAERVQGQIDYVKGLGF
jgi:hypothetical protein